MTILDKAKDMAFSSLGRTSLRAQKYAPVAMTGLGVVGVVAAAVVACKTTMKISPVVEKFREDHDLIEKVRVEKDLDEYPEAVHRKDVVLVYTQAAWGFTKAYAPAIGLGIVSISLIVGGQGILWKRNAVLGSAYAALQTSYNQYRTRVAEAYGPDRERDLYNGFSQQVVDVTDEETGETSSQTVNALDPSSISPYAKFFDEMNPNWFKNDREQNVMWLTMVQNHFTDRLRTRGHVFLNEVYDRLGMDHTSTGALCGWVNGEGDEYVDFGIYDAWDARKRDFVNGLEPGILLNFNCSGAIYDKI